MANLKALALEEEARPGLRSGHSLCAGCGIPPVVRIVLDSIAGPAVVVSATGCLEVATTRYPFTAWGVPWLHVAFENAAAVASGVEAAYRALVRRGVLSGERVTFVVFAGDGGTYDIGLQALSGALERGHRLLYVCYDNEAYMNTGIQRSGATPFGADTTTTPVGALAQGKRERRKDIMGIVAAHHIPYAAQGATSHWQDLSRKVERAAAAEGPAFLNVLATCPLGWGFEAKDSVALSALAVETRFWPLFEVADGRWRITHRPRHPRPLEDWLAEQKRFAHLLRPENQAVLAELKGQVEEQWQELEARAAS
jgi:pyruvate ferredoxin oxidoreductase beta subunit